MKRNPHVDEVQANLTDWRGPIHAQLRELILAAHPNATEEWKWSTAVYTNGKMVCALSPFKNHLKINFFHGSKLADHTTLFNNGFDSKDHRAIDFKEGDVINEAALKALLERAFKQVEK